MVFYVHPLTFIDFNIVPLTPKWFSRSKQVKENSTPKENFYSSPFGSNLVYELNIGVTLHTLKTVKRLN